MLVARRNHPQHVMIKGKQHATPEEEAAVTIQRHVRGHRDRQRFLQEKRAALLIQRNYRFVLCALG